MPVQKFEFVNETPGLAGLMAFTVDWPRGVIRALSTGFWSIEQAKAHFATYASCVREIHQRGGPAYVLVDLRDCAAQSQEVADLLRQAVDGLYRAGDRVAIVMADSIAKMQMRRILDPAYHEYFLSLNAAQNWAFAYGKA